MSNCQMCTYSAEPQLISPLEYYQTLLQDVLIIQSMHPVTWFGNTLEVKQTWAQLEFWLELDELSHLSLAHYIF